MIKDIVKFTNQNHMEKIYLENPQSNINKNADMPKPEIIAFLLNFSKALDVKQCKTVGAVGYLLN